jgi:hypothetical protein
MNYGMVGVINPVRPPLVPSINANTPSQSAGTSLAKQHQMALEADYMLQPGESFPSESTSASSSPSSPSFTSVPGPRQHTLSKGAIASIAIAAVAVAGIAACLFFFVGRARTLKQEVNRSHATIVRTEPPMGPSAAYAGSPMTYTPGAEGMQRGRVGGGGGGSMLKVGRWSGSHLGPHPR